MAHMSVHQGSQLPGFKIKAKALQYLNREALGSTVSGRGATGDQVGVPRGK